MLRHPCVTCALLALAVFAAHGLSLGAAFYMDDFHHILQRETVIAGTGWQAEFFMGRQLTFALWRMLFAVFGPNPIPFHVLNLGLHMACVLVTYRVTLRFVSLAPEGPWREPVAFWGTVLFAVHPLCSEPVNYASQTTILLAIVLAMAATWSWLRYLHSFRLGFGLGALGLALLAGLAKEAGFWHALINLFFVTMLVKERPLKGKRWHLYAVAGVLGVLMASWLSMILSQVSRSLILWHHMLTQARVLGEYLRRMFVPVGLSSDHHVPWTLSSLDLEAVAKLIVVGVIAVIILYTLIRHKKWLAALLGLCLFHLLLRFAYPVDEPMVEYRTYPAMPWVGVFIAYGVYRLSNIQLPRLAIRPWVVIFLLTVTFAFLSARRATVWQSEQRLAMDVLHRYPLNLRAMGIYFKNLMVDGFHEPVVQGSNFPDAIRREIDRHNKDHFRHYSERRMHLDYTSCQYYIIRAEIMDGQDVKALERAERLLADLLSRRLHASEDGLFTAFLSKALCHSVRGEEEDVRDTFTRASGVLPNAEELPAMLENELAILRLRLPGVMAHHKEPATE